MSAPSSFQLAAMAVALSSLLVPGQGRADDEEGARLIALAEPIVAQDAGAGARFSDVFVVTRPSMVPSHYMRDLPKSSAAVCGWVEMAKSAKGELAKRRFFATYPVKAGPPDDSQVAFTIEDNNPKDLTQGAMERSARFLRGWRQYCVDASHPG